MNKIALISVFNTSDPERGMYELFLYTLLQERKPYMNISHKEMPSYEDHIKFVRTNQGKYKEWFLIQDRDTHRFVGTIYLGPENNVGIFILEKYQYKKYGKTALEALYRYFKKDVSIINANIAPSNSASLAFFINLGFKYAGRTVEYNPTEDQESDNETIIQFTYSRTNPYYKIISPAS